MKKNLLKRIVAGVSAVCMLGSLTACNTKIKVEFDYDASQYVKLGQYKGIEVSIDRTEIEDQVIADKIESDIENYTEYAEVKRAAMNEDRVTITFSGSIGGSVVEGFGGEDYTIVLGTDTFLIDGFIDELYGMQPGEQKVVTLTVPEDFDANSDFAGRKIVYEINMTKVEQMNVPMMTDAFVKEKFGCETIAVYKEMLRTNLSAEIEAEFQTVKEELVLTQLQEEAEVTGYPEEFLKTKSEELEKTISFYALMQNMTNDQYCQKNYNLTFDEFVKKSVIQDAVIQLVATTEKLSVTEYEYKDELAAFALEQGYTDKDAFVEKYGKAMIVKNMLFKKAQKFVVDNAVVK